jgi:hypothetical protein
MAMHTQGGRVTQPHPRFDMGEELMGAADAIADMAQRVQLNGPEPVYASEKLGHALYMAAEGLALCGDQLHEVVDQARRGHEHGVWLQGGEPQRKVRYATGSGRGDVCYESPPHSREDAMPLVQLLVGRASAPEANEVRW